MPVEVQKAVFMDPQQAIEYLRDEYNLDYSYNTLLKLVKDDKIKSKRKCGDNGPIRIMAAWIDEFVNQI